MNDAIIIHGHCLRCGRVLKDPKSQVLGYGSSCYKKYLQENRPKNKKLFIKNY